MKKSILHSVFEGDILPWEMKYQRKNPTDMETLEKLEAEYTYFEKSMTTEDRNRFDEYHSLFLTSIIQEKEHEEYQSFLLGLWMGMDLVMEKENLCS